MGNIAFRDAFPKAIVFHVEPFASDHHLILLKLCYTGIRTPVTFKFEALWTVHEGFKRLMQECWNNCLIRVGS